ncbi:hypothetical protein BV898_16690 [Hypsibius exemplaris]|uniref:G-protein coupled receptors family 1 profile domain-containing protein n=1 Tax=Hypsibius exemplaris TaxID=2072580 RepID=A0A9X6NGC3_HYPEX|nr:hypothetical protein BV898_16690 [Hypsibius exemplaris]
MAEDTGNWTNLTGVDYDGWDPDTDPPLSCYSVHNEYTTKAYLVPIYQIIGPILVNLCALSVIGNTVILCTVFFIRKKHLTPTLMFSLSLAGADAVAAMSMGLGFFVNNILLLNFDINIAYRDCIVLVVESFRLATMVCSALHFLMLAVNHWLGIIRPLHYASRMTRKLAWICIVVMWVSPLVGFFAVFSLMPGRGFRSTKCQDVEFAHRFPFRAAVSALFFIPVTLMSVVYVHVFIVLYFHRKRLLSLDVTGSNNDEKRRMQSNTKALVTTLIILLTYLIGWLPAVINYVLVCDGCIFPLTISLCIRLPTNIVTNLLIVLKFLVDPIIYTARIQEVRMVINYPLRKQID